RMALCTRPGLAVLACRGGHAPAFALSTPWLPPGSRRTWDLPARCTQASPDLNLRPPCRFTATSVSAPAPYIQLDLALVRVDAGIRHCTHGNHIEQPTARPARQQPALVRRPHPGRPAILFRIGQATGAEVPVDRLLGLARASQPIAGTSARRGLRAPEHFQPGAAFGHELPFRAAVRNRGVEGGARPDRRPLWLRRRQGSPGRRAPR